MEFSLFNLMTRPQGSLSHAEVMQQMQTMTLMADDAGFGIAWFAEHHLSNYSISPSPLLPVVHMAAKTRKIRLGPAVIVLPFYEPLRLTEEVCMADQLTEGRLVLGLGTGYQPREFAKFGFDLEDRMARGLEVWDVLHQGLTRGMIDFEGQHINIRDAALSVAPVQDDFKTFAVGNAPEIRQKMVERSAIPMTTSGAGPLDLVTTARRLFAETRNANGLDGDDFPFAVQRYVFVTNDRSEADMVAEQILIHARMAANMRRPDPDMNGAMLNIVPFEGEPSLDDIMQRSIMGDAQEVAERIMSDARAHGMTHLSVFMQIAGIPYTNTLKSMDKFCSDVMPVVRNAMAAQPVSMTS